jgi:hypothetical protein
LGLLVLSFKLIEFPEFDNEKPLKAIKEDLKPNLSIKKVFEINSNSNKIQDTLTTPSKPKKRP